MKSRTSSYKRTLFLKNVTRFMPFWGLYTLCLLLGLAILVGSRGDHSFYFAMNMASCARLMSIVNLVYAMLAAQLLFGDLYDSRMCNGLHALPMRREEIFMVNVVSGISFSLFPTLFMALISLPMMLGTVVVNGWQISLLWLLAANLEFLFFFGLAVLCAFVAGNRFSMIVIYGILNIGSLLLGLMVDTLYLPMLKGVGTTRSWYTYLCPVAHMAETPLMIVQRTSREMPGTFTIQPSWSYLWICAAISIVCLLAALVMYRRRSLERAGEFIVIRMLKPVFMVLFSIAMATGFEMVSLIFLDGRFGIVFSMVGLAVGWFVSLMLLEKSTRIFNKKTILGGAVLLAVMGSTFLIVSMDLLGIESWVPDPDQVASVRVSSGYNYYDDYRFENEDNRITDPEEIALVTRLHQLALEANIDQSEDSYDYRATYGYYYVPHREDSERYTDPVSIEYVMKNGRIHRRYYYIYTDGEMGEIAGKLYSRPAYVFGASADILNTKWPATYFTVNGYEIPKEYRTDTEIMSLMAAVRKDCKEGHMAQDWTYHRNEILNHSKYPLHSLDISIGVGTQNVWFNAYADSVHTLKWFEERGLDQKILKFYINDMKRWE